MPYNLQDPVMGFLHPARPLQGSSMQRATAPPFSLWLNTTPLHGGAVWYLPLGNWGMLGSFPGLPLHGCKLLNESLSEPFFPNASD